MLHHVRRPELVRKGRAVMEFDLGSELNICTELV
jgi:hypothetical protein